MSSHEDSTTGRNQEEKETEVVEEVDVVEAEPVLGGVTEAAGALQLEAQLVVDELDPASGCCRTLCSVNLLITAISSLPNTLAKDWPG